MGIRGNIDKMKNLDTSNNNTAMKEVIMSTEIEAGPMILMGKTHLGYQLHRQFMLKTKLNMKPIQYQRITKKIRKMTRMKRNNLSILENFKHLIEYWAQNSPGHLISWAPIYILSI